MDGGDSGVMEVMDADKNSVVLVTGGRGFIGRAVDRVLYRAGCRVLPLDQADSSAPGSGHSSVGRAIAVDITDAKAVRGLFETGAITGIVHLAAILPTAAQRNPVRATEVNVSGSLNLLEMAREFGVKRFVFGSSLSVYGTCAAKHVVAESDRAAPEDLYGAAKLYVEQLGEAYRQAYGLEFVSLRIGRVVGTGARSNTSAWRSDIFECLAPGSPTEIVIPYADSERILLVHVEDVAKMLVELVRAPQLRHAVYNAACESVIVGELKSEVERLNPRVRIRLEGQAIRGNPRRLDWSRLAEEFGIEVVPMFERLAHAKSPP